MTRFRTSTLPLAVLLAVGLAAPARAQSSAEPVMTGGDNVLRVCADPDNMPISSEKEPGFENRIAAIVAKSLGKEPVFAWWPVRRGFFSRALNGRYCDVAITAPTGLDMAGLTPPYFRSAYVIVTRADRGLDIKSLDDPRLTKLKIGVNILNSDAENTPPAMALSAHGVVGNLIGFTTFFSEGGDRPDDIIRGVADGKVDVAIVWGPLAGYFARKSSVPLTLTLLASDSLSGIPFAYSFGMATRRRDRALRDSLQAAIIRTRPEIDAVLQEYAVPLLPLPTGGDK